MLNTYVYFMGELGAKRTPKSVKIGVATSPEIRLKELQTGNPRELKILITLGPMGSSEAYNIEQLLHRKFRRWHMRGEWFKKGLLQQLGRIKTLNFNGKIKIHDDDCVFSGRPDIRLVP